MAGPTDIKGTEFDWFCVDRNGRFALLASAGNGPVPDEALAHADVHAALSDSFEVLNWGTEAVWESYSKMGLYVYDWDDGRDAYVRLATPTASVPLDLGASIRRADGIPRLDVDFDDEELIRLGPG